MSTHDPEFDPAHENAESAARQKEGDASREWILTRRGFIASVGVFTGGVALGAHMSEAGVAVADQGQPAANVVSLKLTINGRLYLVSVDPRLTLLDLLRENLGLTGPKKGCDHGQCGACTVLVNGRRINSCLSLAAVHDGDQVTTIEGLTSGEQLHPLQAAFLEHDGLQCGYCTPGQICSAAALLSEHQRGDASVVTADLRSSGPVELSPEEIRERMSGNICRCGAYPGIVAAVRTVLEQGGKGGLGK